MDKQSLIKEWSRLSGWQISAEELQEICGNLSGCFNALLEWDAPEKPNV